MTSHFSLAAFKIISLSLAFSGQFIICLSVGLFDLILLAVQCTSWMFIFMSSTKLSFSFVFDGDHVCDPFLLQLPLYPLGGD